MRLRAVSLGDETQKVLFETEIRLLNCGVQAVKTGSLDDIAVLITVQTRCSIRVTACLVICYATSWLSDVLVSLTIVADFIESVRSLGIIELTVGVAFGVVKLSKAAGNGGTKTFRFTSFKTFLTSDTASFVCNDHHTISTEETHLGGFSACGTMGDAVTFTPPKIAFRIPAFAVSAVL